MNKSIFLETHIPKVEGDLQVVPEIVSKLWIHIKNLQNVFSKDFVKVAVGQSPHIGVGFPWPGVKVDGLTEDVVLPYKMFKRGLIKPQSHQPVTDYPSYTIVSSTNSHL